MEQAAPRDDEQEPLALAWLHERLGVHPQKDRTVLFYEDTKNIAVIRAMAAQHVVEFNIGKGPSKVLTKIKDPIAAAFDALIASEHAISGCSHSHPMAWVIHGDW